ncbi:growth/differentiation factor 6-A isoform X2 [Betta splendens]|uniref:Growth/differentiation factor 6-A isoform X2 n=1 Tax=Betta splendens TaxID=158456 RepID=A0A6P7LLX0_BETSP|nr:growth/differentiation factor 6-A isoform X2 [Betta splendens]
MSSESKQTSKIKDSDWLHPTDINGSRGFTNTITGFVDKGKDRPSSQRGQHYTFDVSSLNKDELVEAELRILRKPAPDLPTVLSGGNLYSLRLYSCSSHMQLLDSRTVEVLDGGLPKWEVFDVWSSIEACMRSGVEPLQVCFHLLVSSELNKQPVNPLLLGLGHHDLPQQQRALLVVFSHTDTKDSLFKEVLDGGEFERPQSFKPWTNPEKKHLPHGLRALFKRSFSGRSGRRRPRCSRKPLLVNFKDLGWDDWIIAPLNYEAHYCDGVCDFPLRSHLEPTNHAVIQTLISSMEPGISPPSCCVPSSLSPISILYIDSRNNVVYKQYEDMVVESCGCR